MRKLDLIVGVVGGLVLVGALAGAYMEGSTGVAGSGTFSVTWLSKKTTFEPVKAPEATFDVKDGNVTAVHVDARITAGAGFLSTGDKVTLTVEDPDGNVTTKEGTLSTSAPALTLSVDVPVNKVPNVDAAPGADGPSALRSLADANATRKGSGEWKVTIAVARAVNAVGAPTYEISGFDTYYEAALKDAAKPPLAK